MGERIATNASYVERVSSIQFMILCEMKKKKIFVFNLCNLQLGVRFPSDYKTEGEYERNFLFSFHEIQLKNW